MQCPYCREMDSRVVDSRLAAGGTVTWRRRECDACKRRYTTYERIEETVRLQVIKKDGTRIPFDRNKLLAGIQKALYKRPVPATQITRIVDAVEEELSRTGRREVESKLIGDLVMKYLKRIDPIAYVRFASVYREFQDVRQLVDEAQDVMNNAAEINPDQQDLFGA